jgi:phospholipid transport system transporter-binding protein
VTGVAEDVATPLPASLTLRDAPAALASLREAFAASSGPSWRVDAAPLVRVDTSALAVLLECSRIAAAGGRRLEVVGAPGRLAELAHLYGVDGLLGLAPAPNRPVASIGESRPPATPVIPILR